MVFLATINSFAMPVVAILLIRLQFTYYQAGINPEWEHDATTLLILMWFWMVIVIFMGIGEKIVFGVMGEKLTYKLRVSLIEEIMHKQVSWFDREDRAPGIITSVISSDITSLNGMTTEVLVNLFEIAATTSLALIGGFYFCW
jgi:ATP-binding cassette subfamily B (MDR/TAP) protein 1